ncbi:hypothetical protein [Lebetimonas sp. JH292]|uniref:hypothetical protein n=1 Tax=Lebetimonas sp. JH292 TaxID=990068 RepID=UPI000465CADF|nr:hypothetical protein [Lebetimonas sp. JH292]
MDLLTKLNEKIDGLLQKYEELTKENENLKLELDNIKEKLTKTESELLECRENMALKELELEEVVGKIEAILAK